MNTDILTRRDFLLYAGATAAGVTLGEFGRRQLARADQRAWTWTQRGQERWATSVCRDCTAGCGLRVRLVGDVPVKIDGNPLCPISRGRLCARGQAALEAYFDPNRLRGPARRSGAEGDAWTPIDWEPATRLLADAVRRFAGQPGAILAVGAEDDGPIGEAWTHFWRTAGATVVHTPAAHAARLRPSFQALTGAAADPLFDLEHAAYVLSFGAPIVEDWLSPVWAQRAYGRFRRSEGRARGRLVQVDGRESLTARKADEWIALPADRQIALAYGIISVLLREGRANTASLDAHRGNVSAFEAAVVQRYAPDALAAPTGVPVVTMLRLARELTAGSESLVVVAADADRHLVDAVLALNALIGAFDRPGGIYAAPGMSGPQLPPAAPADLAAVRPRLVALKDPSALRAASFPFDVAAAIARADLVVSFSPFMDESGAGAHLLMPAHTALESWQAVIPSRAVPGEQTAVSAPAVQPRLNTQDLLQTLRRVAEAAGEPLAAACAWQSSADVARGLVSRLAQEHRGTPYSTAYETDWIAQLERGGWWTPTVAREGFEKAVVSAGGWCDPIFISGGVRQALLAQNGFAFPDPPMPQSSEPAESARNGEAFPLRVYPFAPALVSLVGSPNQPSLLELLGPAQRHPWHVWVELNPETAHALHVPDGARVRMASAHGSVEAVAVLVEGMPTDTAALSVLPCAPDSGQWAKPLAADVRRLWPRGRRIAGHVRARITRV